MFWLCTCMPVLGADPPANVRIQELEARLADAAKRADFEGAERRRLESQLAEEKARSEALRQEAAQQRRRADDGEVRHASCLDREEGARAELDLCLRSRAAVEEQRNRCRSELELAASGRRAEVAGQERDLEDCRGQVADLEAHNSLLEAEKTGLERRNREKADEIAYNYEALVESARRDLGACQARVAELDPGAAQSLELETERARQAEEASLLRGQVLKELKKEADKGTVSVRAHGARVTVAANLELFFGPGGTELKPGGRDVLKRLGAVARASERAVVLRVVREVPSGAKGKKVVNPWDSVASPATRLALVLREEGDLARDRVAVAAAPPAQEGRGAKARPLLLADLVSMEDFEAVLPPPPVNRTK